MAKSIFQMLPKKEIFNRHKSRRADRLGSIPCLQWLAMLGVLVSASAIAQPAPIAERMANTVLSGRTPTALPWNEDTGLLLAGMDAAWYNSANGDDFRFVNQAVDAYLASRSADSDGVPSTPADTLMARQLLFLYRVTLKPEYFRAASVEHEKELAACRGAANHDETAAQKNYASICLAQPFLAEYANVFDSPGDFATVTASFANTERLIEASLDSAHAAPQEARNASLTFAALVDSLPYYPPDDPGRAQLLEILHHATESIQKHQDTRTGLFYLAEQESAAKNTTALASSNCLLVYPILKAVRLGYLPTQDAVAAERAWRAVSSPASAELDGTGALLLAATEADLAPTATLARGKVVLMDAWYNSQQRKNADGQMESFHYKWNDYADSGYSLVGHLFRSFGAKTDTLYTVPTIKNLKDASVYILVSPDIPIKNPNPHYMNDQEAAAVAEWVKQGGVLVMMENDPPNADLDHLNLLADRFGIHFDNVLHHHILGDHVEDGAMPITPGGPLFHQPHTIYMKDTCAISLKAPAVALFRDRGDVVMAAAKYGRGTVFATVDPWLYNEYTDGRKNPKIYSQFDNFAAGRELVHWLLLQIPGEGTKEKERQEPKP